MCCVAGIWQGTGSACGGDEQPSNSACTQRPSASTELFLQLEAISACESEQNSQALACFQPCLVSASPVDSHNDDGQAVRTDCLRSLTQLEQEHKQQPPEQQQQQKGLQEDRYEGLERGAGWQALSLTDIQRATVASSSHKPAAGAAVVEYPSEWLGTNCRYTSGEQRQSSSNSQPELSGYAPQLWPFGNAPHVCSPKQGVPQHQEPCAAAPENECKSQAKTLTTAEGPLVKQGSYAVAAKQAKDRSARQQKELQHLAAQHAQMRAAEDIKHAGRVRLPSLHCSGLLSCLHYNCKMRGLLDQKIQGAACTSITVRADMRLLRQRCYKLQHVILQRHISPRKQW